MTIAVHISLKLDESAIHQYALPTSEILMDSVNLLLEAAGKQWNLTVSRVPVIGEHILIKGAGRFVVRDVTHTPQNTFTAKIEIELVQPQP